MIDNNNGGEQIEAKRPFVLKGPIFSPTTHFELILSENVKILYQ
jgi:hypothetical protein